MPNLVIAHHLSLSYVAMLEPLLPAGVRLVAMPREAAYEVAPEARILFAAPPRSSKMQVPPVPPQDWPRGLDWVHTFSTGINEFPGWLLDVPLVTCSRGSNSKQIAEFVIGSLLAVAKRFPDSWIAGPAQWRPIEFGTLEGKVLGLLGFGSIATAIARRALPFDMEVLAWRRSGAPGALPGVTVTDLHTVLARADALVVTLPLTDETRYMVDAGFLARVKPGVHLVNVARGAVIDQTALLAALESGQVGFASLDVTEPEPLPEGHPLYGHPRVHVSPHTSWSGTDDTLLFRMFADNLRRFLAGEPLENRVDRTLGY